MNERSYTDKLRRPRVTASFTVDGREAGGRVVLVPDGMGMVSVEVGGMSVQVQLQDLALAVRAAMGAPLRHTSAAELVREDLMEDPLEVFRLACERRLTSDVEHELSTVHEGPEHE